METESMIVDESENWNGGFSKGASFKEIVLNQLQRVVRNLSQEMREGFWIYSQTTHQAPQRIKYIGDSREESKSSIDVLHDLLQPKFDEGMKEKSKEIYQEFEKFQEDYSKKTKIEKEKSSYWMPTLKIYRKMFQELCFFLEKIGWLETDNLEN